MTLSSSQQEQLWIDAWNDLDDLLAQNQFSFILLPDYVEANLEQAQGWIQSHVYADYKIHFEIAFYKGKKPIFINAKKCS
ncbi:hypothetical protein O5O45_15730 [Hahella aquimaris]|uniref:hypothetical protein n=1 Tax=Hahella sp. HNIBRBA332 TaxID=3015983 RepID=UPI00273C084A|nr:hypothetical protein [Hahella sp. HNIBRBA332]WLQ17363.1 hypothetical protein O5O45_15730 [Hahella sp. HNIBRBA332]